MNITVIFFIYGLAFFTMGLAMFFESNRSPLLVEAAVLRPLAIFGLVHGAHEWLEMFLDKSDWFLLYHPIWISWLRISLLAISFVSLLVFGILMTRPLRLLQPNGLSQPLLGGRAHWYWILALYILGCLAISILMGFLHVDYLTHLDAGVRYALAVPGALIAGAALLRQSTHGRARGYGSLSLGFWLSGLGFLLYAVTQAIIPPLDTFPGNIINTVSFLHWTGFPIQAVRALLAVVIMLGLLRVIQMVEVERQRQYLAVQNERLAALEQLQQELTTREAMRQELMRSIVLAQEEERARIARELHDETSQTLTAFSLHLAALRQSARTPGMREKLDLLQTLSRQISLDIYRLVRDLRPAQLDDLGLPSALSYLASENEKRVGMNVSLQVVGDRRRLPSIIETVLFRVAQEALTNASRHSGSKRASLILEYKPDRIHLAVQDEGKGFDPNSDMALKGLGLMGMRERAKTIGGSLEISSGPGIGTQVEIIVPTNGKEEQEIRV
jgi:signal transduction histidine kinase